MKIDNMNKIQREKIKKNRVYLYGFVTVVLLIASVRMLLLSKFSFDEYFTINLIRNSWTDVIRFTALDVHPPLYYLVVKLVVTIFGEHFFSWHMTSFVCFLCMLFVTERFVTENYGEKEGSYAVLALCAAPHMLRYCLQVRMYSMAMLFVTWAFYLTYDLLAQYGIFSGKGAEQTDRRKCIRTWAGLAIVNVAAAYTHYFAGVAVAGLSLFLLLFLLLRGGAGRGRRLLHWLCFCAAMTLSYLPWLFVLVRQMGDIQGNYWIRRLNMETLWAYWDMLFGMSSDVLRICLILLFVAGAYCLFVRSRTERDAWRWGSFFAAGFLLLFGVGYSVLRTPILIDRYLIVLVPMLWVSVLLALLEKREKWIEIVLLVVFGFCFVQNVDALYQEYAAVENSEETRCLKDNMEAGDVFYHTNVQRLAERAAFLPQTTHLLQEGCDAGEAFHYWTEMIGCREVPDAAAVMAIAGDVVWCEDDECLETFTRAGWQVEEYPAWSVTFYRLTRPSSDK